MFNTFISLATDIMLANPTVNVQGLPNVGKKAEDIVTPLLNTVYFFAGAAAVVAIIMGGFWYVTANGDASQIQKGKNAILYACIGLVVVMMAFTITGFVSGRF